MMVQLHSVFSLHMCVFSIITLIKTAESSDKQQTVRFINDIKNDDLFNDIDLKEKSSSQTKNAGMLKLALKKAETYFTEWRRKKYEKIAKTVSRSESPFQGCSRDPYPPSESKSVKKFEINLDANPEVRWKEVIQQHNVQIKKLEDYLVKFFGRVLMRLLDKMMTSLHRSLPTKLRQELDGISVASGISVSRVTLYNVFYEIFSVCTSIVMEDEDGKMYHGRNLDFGMLLGWDSENNTWIVTELLKPTTIKVDFVKKGKLLYSAVTYAGYVGILTGVKKNAFSLTINDRFAMNGGFVGFAEWFKGQRGLSWLALLTREVMETATSYEDAQKMLANRPLIAPVYFILAGNSTHQGSIVTRHRKSADIWPLGSKHKRQRGSWFLVQTNWDHWKEPPFFDDRRNPAVKCMDELGQGKPLETLYRVLSTKPVLNKETTLTALMDVKEGLLEVWKRSCPGKCWPF